MKRTPGRPRQGIGLKKQSSIRIEENLKEKIIIECGSIQRFFDKLLNDFLEKKGFDNESI